MRTLLTLFLHVKLPYFDFVRPLLTTTSKLSSHTSVSKQGKDRIPKDLRIIMKEMNERAFQFEHSL